MAQMRIRVIPEKDAGKFSFNDLATSSKDLAASVAIHQERTRILKVLNDHVTRTDNTYFNIDELTKIISDRR